MNPTNIPAIRPSSRTKFIFAMGCALSLTVFGVPALSAADTATTLQPLADIAPALPLTHSFTKVEGGDKGPYVLQLKNESKSDVTVTGKILLAVAFHAESRSKNIPAHKIEAGQSWSIADLAFDDRITLTAEGFAPLELKVK